MKYYFPEVGAWQETPELHKDLPNIAVYGSHNGGVAVEYKGELLEVIEFERLLNNKNIGWCQYMPARSRKYLADFVNTYLKDKYGFDGYYGKILYQHCAYKLLGIDIFNALMN